MTKLAKYLPEFGWLPLILTAKPAAYYHYDPELLGDLARARIYRTESFDPARFLNLLRPSKSKLKPVLSKTLGRGPRLLNYLLFPDSKAGWFPFASRIGRHIIDREKPAAIFATGPPFTALLLGVRLKAHGHIPLVTDFRDPWPTGFTLPPQPQRALLRHVREYIVKHADAVLAVNDGTAAVLGGRAKVLPNGFDPEEFEVEPVRLEGFSVVHVGNLWQNQREILEVCEALSRLPEARFYLAGRVDKETENRLARTGQVRLLGTLPHRQVCALMKGADVLLYVGKPQQAVGLKLYEYLGARRPILVYGKGAEEAARIVEQCGAGLVCGDIQNLIPLLLQLRRESKRFIQGSRDGYDRRVQARLLAELLEELVVGTTP